MRWITRTRIPCRGVYLNGSYRIVGVTTTRGRRRDPLKDEAILGATRELLVEVGYAALSMAAVAARAGVSKPTLYLRYSGKVALVFEAVFGRTKTRELPDSGSVVADLREAYSWAVEEFAAPEARAALPGLLAEIAASPELGALVRRSVVEPEYARVRSVLELGQERGEIRNDVDLELVIDAFTGTALARVTLLDHPVNQEYGARLVDLLVQALRPPPAP
jgi:AcrR family transcriptional regulator